MDSFILYCGVKPSLVVSLGYLSWPHGLRNETLRFALRDGRNDLDTRLILALEMKRRLEQARELHHLVAVARGDA